MFLGGRCRFCKAKISFRYFIVELISASAALILYMNFGFASKFWIYSLLTFALIVVTFIDLEFQIIPDRISIAGLFLGLIFSILIPQLHNTFSWKIAFMDSLLGVASGGGLIYLTGFLGQLAFKKESMGGGDVKLMAMIGAFLGWKMAILIFFLAPFFGTPAGLYLKFIKKQDIIPYGPYLSMASFISMFLGLRILGLFIP
jgi:leader peptidase (prepilin peptidase)/N-methyltransferase